MKKRILTGLKPTGVLHVGNYFGSIAHMLEYQKEDFDTFLFLASMHSFTELHDGNNIKELSMMALKLYLACGIDPEKTLIYNSADIPAHAQLNRVLACITTMGYMGRMHVYKDAINKGMEDKISVGTFNYPILMAADILLYDTDLVPVGKDQKQHVEFARDIGEKFNNMYGETFKIPQPYISEAVATIPGIDGRKMSKSYNNYIALLEEEDMLLKKIKMIPTDAKTVEEPKDPDTCNVYNILKLFLTEDENKTLRDRYTAGGLSYKEVKEYAYTKIKDFLTPIKRNYAEISDQQILDMLEKNSKIASEIADKKVQDVYKKVGFILK